MRTSPRTRQEKAVPEFLLRSPTVGLRRLLYFKNVSPAVACSPWKLFFKKTALKQTLKMLTKYKFKYLDVESQRLFFK
uniref:Uncharacterized protein n=1 Tax=Anguilla anguilla TaxID=7936 RepID=A0A0E9Q2A7_ANGAN